MLTNRPVAPNKGKSYPAEPLTPTEVAAVISQCSPKAPTGIRNRAMLTLLYRSGLRISELLALRPGDVNLAKHTVRLLDTKSGKPQTRGFHPTADDALARWMDTRRELAARNGWKNGKLFCCLDGEPVSDDYVRVLLRRLAVKSRHRQESPPARPETQLRRRARGGRNAGDGHLQAAGPQLHRRYRALPRPPDQRPGRRRPPVRGAGRYRLTT
jgi:site-specific recombinase XerD